MRLTQSQFDPIPIGERIWVVPSWHDAPGPRSARAGTRPGSRIRYRQPSHHASVHGMAGAIGEAGSIRARLRLRLGHPRDPREEVRRAIRCIGIDIDPQAVESARQNSERNRAEVTYGLPDDCPAGEFDIVVANILSNPLKLMASMLSSKVKPGGRIALSGILARQADEVARRSTRAGSTSAYGANTKVGCVSREHAAKAIRISAYRPTNRPPGQPAQIWLLATRCPHCETVFRLDRHCSRRTTASCAADIARKCSTRRIISSN